MAKKTDQKTLDLIKEVARRKAEIAKADRPNWKTNCSFACPELGSGGTTINLHVEGSVRMLINYAAFVLSRERAYTAAALGLAVDNPPEFEWCGFSAGDWIEDIKTRINKIQIASKRKSLETLESRLNAIISPELRAELELEAIANELN